MAQIHNTAELRERAHDHAANDRILQGTYGKAKTNGEVQFWGCAIACLATPHREPELFEWVRERITAYGSLIDGAERQLDRLEDQFGIVPELGRVIECIFESLEFHGEAIEFLPKVADAMPEGADIDANDVRNWWEVHTPDGEVNRDRAAVYGGWEPSVVGDELVAWLSSMKAEVAA